jgi:hypothetical protein
MSLSDAEVAARCIDDPAYAREVLNGDDHPAVRAAIVADWRDEEVSGYFNPQPDPPGFQADIQNVAFDGFAQKWKSIGHPNLNSFVVPG